VAILGDPAHKIINASLTMDEMLEHLQMPSRRRCWRWRPATTADGQLVEGQASRRPSTTSGSSWCPTARIAVVQDAGHMLHHDQPERWRGCSSFLA
jgi:pimeloyl-ACP methyl ester carboxylesterase